MGLPRYRGAVTLALLVGCRAPSSPSSGLSSTGEPGPLTANAVAVVVNGEPIPTASVLTRMSFAAQRGLGACADRRGKKACRSRDVVRELRHLFGEAVSILVTEALERQAASRLHVEVTARESSTYHEQRAIQESTSASSVWKPKSDWARSDVEQWERAQVIRERLPSALAAPRIAKIDEVEVRRAYRKFVEDWWARRVRYFRVPFPDDADVYARDEAYRKAQKLFERARAGEDVCDLVKQYGDTDCGLRRWWPGDWNTLLPPTAIEVLRDGEVLPPRDIGAAYQVVQRRGPAPPSLDEVRAKLQVELRAEEIRRAWFPWFDEQMRSAKIEDRKIEERLFVFEDPP